MKLTNVAARHLALLRKLARRPTLFRIVNDA